MKSSKKLPKSLDTLIQDIDNLFLGADVSREGCDEFGKRLADLMYDKFREYKTERKKGLRMSMIGTPDRKAWYSVRDNIPKQEHSTRLLRTFLTGDIFEEVLLFLAKEAGHTVTEEQAEINILGVKGHKDCRIDGVTVDIKTASTRSFEKFNKHKLEEDDPFGYRLQIAGYLQNDAEKGKDNREVAFLVWEKQFSNICLDRYTADSLPIASDRISTLKVVIEEPKEPERCSEPVIQKNGNVTLSTMCSYCDYKRHCWRDANNGEGLRVFEYSTGDKYFIEVNSKLRVREVL